MKVERRTSGSERGMPLAGVFARRSIFELQCAGRHSSGVTILEVLMAIFVMLIGVTGVIALFPVGVKLSQMSCDDIVSAMTAQNALAAVRCQNPLLKYVDPYTDTTNTDGSVLGWTGTESKGIEGISGTVAKVGEGGLAVTELEVSCGTTLTGRTLDVKLKDVNDKMNDRALLLITSGEAIWKLYRLDEGCTTSPSPVKFVSTQNGCTSFPGDSIKATDTFRLIGARNIDHVWATVPSQFYGNGTSPPAQGYKLGQGAADGYGYLAIVTRVYDSTSSFRVDILVYKGYDTALPPEGNLPAVACYTTILSREMLR